MWAKLTVAGLDFLIQGDDSTYGSYYPVRPYYQLTDSDFDGHNFSLTINYLQSDFAVYDLSPGYTGLASGSFNAEFIEETITPGPYTLSVPETGAWAMMAIGFGAIGGAIRYRNRRRVSIRGVLAGHA